MDFTQSTEQVELAGLTRRILQDLATPARLAEVGSEPDRVDRPLWKELAQAGILAAALPDEVGGSGLGLSGQCAVLVELGRAVAPVPYLAGITLGASAVARFGDDRQRRAWAEPAGRGELLLTACLGVEQALRAEQVPGGWRLSGTATTVPAGPYADVVLLPMSTVEGPVVLSLLPGVDGVSVQRQYLVDGQCAGRIELDGVELPGDRVLGGTGHPAGVAAREWLHERAAVGLSAFQLGVIERALELTCEHARNRVQFGRPIGSFQAVGQRLADAYLDVEALRCTMWQAAWLLDQALPCPTQVATAKFWAADAGDRVAHTAVHVHGGTGIDLGHRLHRYFVAASYAQFALGGATEQLLRIGAALATDPPAE